MPHFGREKIHVQLVDEHCAAFAYNNSSIKAYKVGWITPLLGFIKLIGNTSTAFMTVAIAVVMYLLWGQIQGRHKL
jgi:hypothetical protein